MESNPKNRLLIVADAHLPLDNRRGGEQQTERFIKLLKQEKTKTSTLVLLGDIFDFWYEWDHVIPKRAFPVLLLLHQFVLDGISVHYFAGNHDFRIKGFLETEIGLSVHMNQWETTVDGKRVYFHHGDGMAASDSSYRKMKRVFRSRWAQNLFKIFVHPDFAMQLGRRTSDGGRHLHNSGKKKHPLELEYVECAQSLARKGFDIIVFGHTHMQASIPLEGGVFFNPGPFLEQHRFGILEDGVPRSEVFEA